ncbi:hypothetical protein SVIOM342S_03914 [Streptomyces violaceorubidus]
MRRHPRAGQGQDQRGRPAGQLPRKGDNEYWNLEVKYENGGPNGVELLQIRNVTDQLCMDLGEYGARPEGTGVAEFHCNGTKADNQLWWIDKQASGNYWIRNFASAHRCLNVKGQNGGTETPLNIATCTNDHDQEWDIIRRSGRTGAGVRKSSHQVHRGSQMPGVRLTHGQLPRSVGV